VQQRLARPIPPSETSKPLERRICEHTFVGERKAEAVKMDHAWSLNARAAGWAATKGLRPTRPRMPQTMNATRANRS
jgi:hypothetical protein